MTRKYPFRISKNPWVKQVTKNSILNEQLTDISSIKKLLNIGRGMRASHLKNIIMPGTTERQRKRGRPRATLLDEMNTTVQQLSQVTP